MKAHEKIINDPKLLFFIDGFGALVSAVFLGVIMTQFESNFGMPSAALYFLVIFPILFFAYDLVVFFFIKKNWTSFIRIIAISNLFYLFLSAFYVYLHFEKLTLLGFCYFLLEMAIIMLLLKVEFQAAATVKD